MAITRTVLVALALALVPGCDDDDDDDIIIDDPVGVTTDEGIARGEVLAAEASVELTGDDFAIVIGKTATILRTLNDGEIAQAEFAIQVVDDDDVFDYANRMIIEHEEANAVLDTVVRGYGVPYLPSTTADMLAAEAADGLSLLRSTPPDDVDFRYIELQVIMHAGALVLLDELAVQVGPGAMGDYIFDTQGLVEAHLAEAQDLLSTFF